MKMNLDPRLLWSGVRFRAQGGRTAALLQAAAMHNIPLRMIRASFAGFGAACTAGEYLRLAALARRYRVHMQVTRRTGLCFSWRHTLRRAGLWAGVSAAGILLILSGPLVWSVQYPGLSAGERARAAQILRRCGIREGTWLTAEMLTEGETALVEQSTDFSWASLNFTGGRLTVETDPAESKPPIAQSSAGDICARADGVVEALDVQQGTPVVTVGQAVAAGQVLIAAARPDHSGQPVTGRTAGSVLARIRWSDSAQTPLQEALPVPDARLQTEYRLSCGALQDVRVPQPFGFRTGAANESRALAAAVERERHYGPSVLGLPLPAEVCERTVIPYRIETVTRGKTLALALARLELRRRLEKQWPGAVIRQWTEQEKIAENTLFLRVEAEISANIGTETE